MTSTKIDDAGSRGEQTHVGGSSAGERLPRRATLRDIHDAVRADGEQELRRTNAALIWSGLWPQARQ